LAGILFRIAAIISFELQNLLNACLFGETRRELQQRSPDLPPENVFET
jgi:hypothetical protein